MINLKAKWKALLLTVSCFFVCFGIGVATVDKPLATNVTATAEGSITTYNVGMLAVDTGSNAKGIYLKRADNEAFAKTDGTWTEKLTFEAGSGTGAKLNDATLTDMAIPGTIYVVVGEAKPGDVFTIAGAFYNTNLNAKYVVTESKFMWTGSSWVGYAETYTDAQLAGYDTVTIHRLDLGTKKVIDGVFDGAGCTYQKDGNNSSTGVKFRFGYNSEDTTAGQIEIRLRGGAWEGFHFRISKGCISDINGDWLEVPLANNVNYNIELGAIDTKDGANVWVYIKINGVLVTTKTVAKSDSYNPTTTFSAFTTRSISIYADPGTKATLSVGYETQNMGAMSFVQVQSESQTNMAYFKSADGRAFISAGTDENVLWNSPFTVVPGSGTGVTLNGAAGHTVKFPGNMFVELNKKPEVNDVLIIDGTFINETLGVKYHVSKCAFQWNGSAWVEYALPSMKDYKATSIGATNDSNASALFLYPTGGIDAFPNGNDGAWKQIYTFEPGSGDGMKLGDVTLTTTDIKMPGTDFYINMGKTASKGDVFTIDGAYFNEAKGIRIVFEDCALQWNGSAWLPYVKYGEKTITITGVHEYSKLNGAYATDNYRLCLAITGGANVSGWPWFVYESGAGFKVNGTPAQLTGDVANAIQDMNGGLYFTFNGVKVGDTVSIGGVFSNAELAIRYTIPETKFVWMGNEWAPYIEYDEKTITITGVHEHSKLNGAYATDNYRLCLSIAGGANVSGWPWFVYESGAGFKVNGTPAQLTGDVANAIQDMNGGLYFTFNGVNVGDTVSIGGVFSNAKLAIRYKIPETKFIWMGSEWIPYVEFTTITLGKVVIGAGSSASAVYFDRADGGAFEITDGEWKETLTFLSGSGLGITLQNSQIAMTDIKIPNNLYVGLGTTATKGDVLKIGGTFYNTTLKVKYVIEESEFVYYGATWGYAEDKLATYDTVSLVDFGLGAEKVVEGVYNGSSLFFTPSKNNTTNSVKFRFGFNSVNTKAGEVTIRLRGGAWEGFEFKIGPVEVEKDVFKGLLTGPGMSVELQDNTYYEIEIGAIDLKDGTGVWTYLKLNGSLVATKTLVKSEYSDYTTNNISLYVSTTKVTLSDPEHVVVTYETSLGTTVAAARKNSVYTLAANAKMYNTFVGWIANGTLYPAGAEFTTAEENLTFTALEIGFEMKDGAAIRIASDATTSGIRFTTLLKETDLNALPGNYGIKSVSFGTLIMPYDYLGAGEAPNLDGKFVVGSTIIKIPSTIESGTERWEVKEGYLLYRGAMQNLNEGNYDRLFAGRGYMEITFENGEMMTVYTPFDKKENVRSIRYVAQAFQVDTSTPVAGEIRYNQLSETRKGIVNAYAAVGEIELMDYAAYAANNFLTTIAWNYPELDASNGYNNDKNIAIATQMKAAGIKVVNLTGKNLLVMTDQASIEKTRQIINFFWSQGLQTIAFAGNTRGMEEDKEGNLVFGNMPADFTQLDMPDFSDCAGFIGFMFWDEPTKEDTVMTKLADLAIEFNNVYAGSDVIYMNNLLPSYSSLFTNTTAYQNYVKEYCEKVLSKVKGEKWLSVDSYPVKADYSLDKAFLLDLGVLKTNAMEVGAHAHVALQSSGFENSQSSAKKRIPTEAEMRMQAYAAMAFGIDSISWFSYSPSGSDSETFYTFIDNNGNPVEGYEAEYQGFINVNKELAKIGAVYSAFTWKGIILGRGDYSYSKNKDYSAFSDVMNNIDSKYKLSASNTKHIASITKSEKYYNYLMGVMQDASGNEGYVLCNYNALGSKTGNKAQTITLTFKTDVSKVVIYRGGEMSEVDTTTSGANRTLDISLATGEGVIVLPSKLVQ